MLPAFRKIAFGSSIYIPDVSEWNDISDIGAVKRAGYHALMMRVAVETSPGHIREDYKFAQGRLPYVVKAGIVPIFYAYLQPSSGTARGHARYIYSLIEKWGGFRRYGALPFVPDIEQTALGYEGTVEWESEFNEEMKHLTGRGGICYDPNWFWGNRGAPRQGSIYWASDYRTPYRWASPVIPAGFSRRFYFWQFSEKYRVPGIDGDVDMSIFRGTTKQFEALRLGW